jgi:hypothetical protein
MAGNELDVGWGVIWASKGLNFLADQPQDSVAIPGRSRGTDQQGGWERDLLPDLSNSLPSDAPDAAGDK